jgi:hypothetical protein
MNRHLKSFAGICFACPAVLLGCDKQQAAKQPSVTPTRQQPSATSTGQQPSAKAADPVAEFKDVIDHGITNSRNERGEVYSYQQTGRPLVWVKRKYDIGTPSYDVTRSDSLVSPFLAVLTFEATSVLTSEFQTKIGAEASNDFSRKVTTPDKYEFRFAYQDGIWVFKSAKVYALYPSEFTGWQEIKPGHYGSTVQRYFEGKKQM